MGPHRGTTALAWSLFVLWAAIAVATAVVGSGQPSNRDYYFPLMLVGYAAAGALVAARHPRNAVGWLLLGVALTVSLMVGGDTYVIPHANPGYVAVAWVSGWLFYVWFALVVAFLPLVFPTGQLLSPRWRVVLWFEVATLVAGVGLAGLTPGQLAVTGNVQNPLGVHGTARTVLATLEPWVLAATAVGVLLSGLSLILRFRRSRGAERQQLKWFAFACLLVVGSLALSGVAAVVPGRWSDTLNDLGWWVFLFSAILGIPLATGIAILRHRLYDIDVVINRTLVYGTLTASLLVFYVGSILVLRALLSPLTGDNNLAVAGSTLAVAALFRPARARIQAVVDRRFFRHKYDATQTLNAFSSRLRHEVDLEEVGSDLRSAVARSVQPSHISLWLRN
jgi:hypothetical protein